MGVHGQPEDLLAQTWSGSKERAPVSMCSMAGFQTMHPLMQVMVGITTDHDHTTVQF
jgi:hypothetical protein